MKEYIVLELAWDYPQLVTNEFGELKSFSTYDEAKVEASECTDGKVIDITHQEDYEYDEPGQFIIIERFGDPSIILDNTGNPMIFDQVSDAWDEATNVQDPLVVKVVNYNKINKY